MANPSRYPMFIRLVGGNVADPYPGAITPDPNEGKISGHTFICALQMWANGEVTKQDAVDQYNLTHADDSGDLDNLKAWFAAATKQEKFADIVEWRIILAREKRGAAGTTEGPLIVDMDGVFGYAVKGTFIDGVDGVHSLKDTGAIAARFNSWA